MTDRVAVIRLRDFLLVTIQSELDDRAARALQESLLERAVLEAVRGVILDLSAVDVIDSYITRILSDISRAVRFLGAECILVGIRPAVAMTLVEMGLDLPDVRTARSLDVALSEKRMA